MTDVVNDDRYDAVLLPRSLQEADAFRDPILMHDMVRDFYSEHL